MVDASDEGGTGGTAGAPHPVTGSASRLGLKVAALIAVAFAGIAAYDAYGPPRNLGQMEERIARQWPGIETMERGELADLMSSSTAARPLILDVRESEEFAVSRIAGAVRISPEVTREDLLRDIGDKISGRQIVLYCSVGVRSALVIRDLGADLAKAGAARVSNLRGGVFGWHNDGRPLVDASGPTDRVHGFGPGWSHLVRRQASVRPHP